MLSILRRDTLKPDEKDAIITRIDTLLRRYAQALALAILCVYTSHISASTSTGDLAKQGARITYHAQTGKVRFIGTPAGAPVGFEARARGGTDSAIQPERHVHDYGVLFGLRDPATELELLTRSPRTGSGTHLRYRQLHRGIPVIGGELFANSDIGGRLISMGGEISPDLELDIAPLVSADDAEHTALAAIAKWYAIAVSELRAEPATLSVYDPGLLNHSSVPASLVWRTEVRSKGVDPIRELVLIDALSGRISLHFNRIHRARDRETYDAGGTGILPGTLICDENQPDCTAGADPDADAAHRYAGDTYDFYASHHGRDSIDDAGMTLLSSVHFNDGFTCPNAFWDGARMVYCNGFSQPDDVVGHELTHGVTERSSNLFYYYQSGAINESLSDVWGEFVDLTNTGGDDSAAARWLMGEDLPAIGAIRNMRHPPAFGDPDRVGSPLYHTTADDNGGVHINSGINNKAAYLMTDGGDFNGFTVAALGIDKVAAIYYEAQTTMLTSGSDYASLYDALIQACANLVGNDDIVAADCGQVENALDAVEMNADIVSVFNPRADLCAAGLTPIDLLNDDLESGADNWSFSSPSATGGSWIVDTGYSSSGTHSLWDQADTRIVDIVAELDTDIAIPGGSSSYLHFQHAFGFEFFLDSAFDGGFLEYSTDSGTNWSDAGDLIDAGQAYNGELTLAGTNLNAGHPAFISESHGYVSTRLNLAPLAGESVRFRWRTSNDAFVLAALGWVVDDVRVYLCSGEPRADAGPDRVVDEGAVVILDGTGSRDGSGSSESLTYAWLQTGGDNVSLTGTNTATPGFTMPTVEAGAAALLAGDALTFQLTVEDALGATAADEVTLTVNGLPTADAGPALTVETDRLVALDGTSSSDPEGAPLAYQWTQLDGTAVVLNGAGNSTPNFVSPAVAGALSFQLEVTDSNGAGASDTVTVEVESPPPADPPADDPPADDPPDGDPDDQDASDDDDDGSSSLDLLLLFLLGFAALARSRTGTASRVDRALVDTSSLL